MISRFLFSIFRETCYLMNMERKGQRGQETLLIQFILLSIGTDVLPQGSPEPLAFTFVSIFPGELSPLGMRSDFLFTSC